MIRYPLLFGFNDVMLGEGFIVKVALDGRALLVQETDDEFWMYGVNPGALAAPGSDHGSAYNAFRTAYKAVLADFAEESTTFAEFKSRVERFVAETNEPTEAEWWEAVEEIRAGKLSADWLARRQSADTPVRVKVGLIVKPTPDANKVDKGGALAVWPDAA